MLIISHCLLCVNGRWLSYVLFFSLFRQGKENNNLQVNLDLFLCLRLHIFLFGKWKEWTIFGCLITFAIKMWRNGGSYLLFCSAPKWKYDGLSWINCDNDVLVARLKNSVFGEFRSRHWVFFWRKFDWNFDQGWRNMLCYAKL